MKKEVNKSHEIFKMIDRALNGIRKKRVEKGKPVEKIDGLIRDNYNSYDMKCRLEREGKFNTKTDCYV